MTYNLLRGLHILAVIAWMAGLLYLPRLFVYHCKAAAGSEMDAMFQTMELRLYRFIMGPAMVVAWIFGLALLWYDAKYRVGMSVLTMPAMLLKLAGVVFLSWWHHVLGAGRKRFATGTNTRSEKYWRMVNEIPFVAAIIMVLAVTVGVP